MKTLETYERILKEPPSLRRLRNRERTLAYWLRYDLVCGRGKS